MFTPKVNSKQKCVKKTQECETRNAVTVQLAAKSPRARLASCTRHQLKILVFLSGKPSFFTPKPYF